MKYKREVIESKRKTIGGPYRTSNIWSQRPNIIFEDQVLLEIRDRSYEWSHPIKKNVDIKTLIWRFILFWWNSSLSLVSSSSLSWTWSLNRLNSFLRSQLEETKKQARGAEKVMEDLALIKGQFDDAEKEINEINAMKS